MSPYPTPFIAGNWKMHLGPDEATEFFNRFFEAYSPSADRTIAFFPPAVSLAAARTAAAARDDIEFGVQNVYWEEKGAYTGEISAKLAGAAGATLILVGHSERRALFGETPADTAKKTLAVLAAGLTPVLCVGETLEQREKGEAAKVVETQLGAVLEELDATQAGSLVVAYEPVWAIGTGRTASPGDAEEMHRAARAYLVSRVGEVGDRIPLLYGGSVKPENAAALLSASEVNGLLVGGASLDPNGFARICTASG